MDKKFLAGTDKRVLLSKKTKVFVLGKPLEPRPIYEYEATANPCVTSLGVPNIIL